MTMACCGVMRPVCGRQEIRWSFLQDQLSACSEMPAAKKALPETDVRKEGYRMKG